MGKALAGNHVDIARGAEKSLARLNLFAGVNDENTGTNT
jgi:hypothetical protein